jgi:septin family protein
MSMTFKIITIDERLKSQSGVKMIIVGPYGIGKTSLIKTLSEPTLCVDLEAGLLAVQDWQGATITIRTRPEARDLACLIGGPNPALRSEQAYSARHFEKLKAENSLDFSAFQVIFIDSLTVAARLCFQWCKQHLSVFWNARIR